MEKMKRGEKEAYLILENLLNISLDNNYHDDNSMENMPDLKTTDNIYIEVTHTYHNQNISKANKFERLEVDAKNRILKNVADARERISSKNYQKNADGNLTENGKEQFQKDRELIKTNLGFDYSTGDYIKKHEWCDCPSVWLSADNIIDAIDHKNEKYKDKKLAMDLFVFATIEEIKYVEDLYKQRNYNKASAGFVRNVLSSTFNNIYICEFNLEKGMYNTENPKIIVLSKLDNKSLSFNVFN